MKSCSCFLLALLWSGCLYSATLSEIYNLAVNNDPQLGIAQATYLARKEIVAQSRSQLWPQVSVGASTSDSRRTSPGTSNPTIESKSHSWQASIRQPVFRLDRWFLFQGAKNAEEQALATFASEQQDLIIRVAEDYLGILEAHDRLTSSNAEREAVERQLEQVQQRFDVGLVAITDVLESTAAYDSSTVNVIEAEGGQVISFERLLRLTGQSFVEISSLSPDFPIDYPEPSDESAWVETALLQNYSLIAAREAVRSSERNLRAAKAAYLPTIDAIITYTESTTTSGGDVSAIIFGSKTNNRTAALQLNVPVFTGGLTTSRVREAGYNLQQAQKNYDFTQRTVVENTRNFFSAINTDVARVRARLRGIESSQSALDATQTGYEVGTRNIVDVLLAQRSLYLAQFQYASARYQYIRDTLRLKQLSGSLGPDDIYDINQFIESMPAVSRITPTTR